MEKQIHEEAIAKTQERTDDDLNQGVAAEVQVNNQILDIFLRQGQNLPTDLTWMLEGVERVG